MFLPLDVVRPQTCEDAEHSRWGRFSNIAQTSRPATEPERFRIPVTRREGDANPYRPEERTTMPIAFIGTVLLIVIIIIVLAVIGLFSLLSRARRSL
jgi:hypothetical protein